MTPLLVLVDLQEDFLAEPGLQPHRDRIVAGAVELVGIAHAGGWPIIHVHTIVDAQTDRRMPHWKQAGRWSCVDGTPGASAPAPLVPLTGEPIITKTGFRAEKDALISAAREFGDCDVAIVAGVHTHACVREAAIDLHQAGYAVRIARDAVGSHDALHAAQTELYFARRFIPFVATEALVEQSLSSVTPERSVAADIDRYVRAAAPPKADITERARTLERAATLVEEQGESLAHAIVADVGKPIRYAHAEVLRIAALFNAVAMRAVADPLDRDEPEALVRRRPLGRVAVITPWNNPLAIAAGQVAPAWVYGNSVLWKPAPAGNGCARLLHALLLTAGVEPATLQLMTGGAAASMDLIRNEGVDAVCFTGSTATGRLVAALCVERGIPLQAELGGNNAAIVTSSADLEHAADLIADAAFGCAGQRCMATRRAIVTEAAYDDFLQRLIVSTATLGWGDPLVESTRIGPVVDARQAWRVDGIVARARAAGHTVLQPHLSDGRAPHDDQWTFVAPAIVLCDDPSAEIVQEESFGPILVVQRARDWPHALGLANGVRQGLAAALFSASRSEIDEFLHGLRAGILKLNQGTVEAGVDVPFLGWKESGIGPAQHGDGNAQFFTRPQAVYGQRHVDDAV